MKKEVNKKLQELHERLYPAQVEEKKELKIELKGQGRGKLPLYYKYPGDFQPLSGGLELNLETGKLETYIHPERNAEAERFYNGRSIFVELDSRLKLADVKAFVREHQEDFRAVLAGSEIIWDGSNRTSRLSDDAQAALDRLCYAAYYLEAY